MKRIITLFILPLLFFACNNEPIEDTNNINDLKTPERDSSEIIFEVEKDSLTKTEAQELDQNLGKITEKYGEQWGFCDCVKANDSVNNALIEMEDFEGKAFEKLMERSEEVTKRCQAFLSLDAHKTPEERAKHEQKVKNCLKN